MRLSRKPSVTFKTTLTLLGLLLLHSTQGIAGKTDDTLNVAFSAEPESLDTYKIAGREGLILTRHIYDGLLYKNLDTGEFEPALATGWNFIDPLTLELELREGVKFHNGDEFDADDVVFTLNTVSDESYGARYQIAVDWIERVEKLESYKVRILMSKPFAGALEMLADSLSIYPKSYFEEGGSEAMAANPIGTGPYRLAEQTPGVRYVFERFDDHYAGSPKGTPAIQKIVVRTIPEQNTQFAELMAGKLDWTWRIPPDQASKLESRVQIVNAPIMRIGYVAFSPNSDEGNSPLASKEVRQAILHAVNREAMVKAFVGGSSQVLHSACNPKQFGCAQDVTQYEYDPEKARGLLASAGYASGLSMEMVFSAMPKPQAEVIAADLAAVGIQVELNEQQYAAGISQWREGDLPLFSSNWGSYGIGDVVFILSNFFGGGGDDVIADPELIEWIGIADTATDPEEREKLYARALAKIADEAYWMPLYDFNINYGMSNDLSFTPHPDEFARWWASSWK